MLVAPCVFLPFTSVNGEQFWCYKSPKGEEGREPLTGSTVADGDLQSLLLFFMLQATQPQSHGWSQPPFLCWGCSVFPFSGVWTPFPSHSPLFLLLLSFPCINWICPIGANLFCSFFFFASLLGLFPIFSILLFCKITLSFRYPPFWGSQALPPLLGSTHPSPLRGHFCLSISAVGTQFWAPGPVCGQGKLCLSKRVPKPAPNTTKEAFFAHQWLPLTPGPLPLEGMSDFPRWHTEMPIRGRKLMARASWEICQEEEGHREHEATFCVPNSVLYTNTYSPKDTLMPLHNE